MPFDLSFGELLVVGIVALLLFGGRLPEVARKAGRAFAEFRRGMREEARKLERELDEPSRPPIPPAALPIPPAKKEAADAKEPAGPPSGESSGLERP